MTNLKTKVAALSIAAVTLATGAFADDKANVQKFYDFLSNPGSETHADALVAVIADDWQSVGDYSGDAKSREAFIGQLGGFSKLIPDLNWSVEDMIEADGKVIVRGRATGTPVGPLFGVDGEGRSFVIMSIDIHTLEDGKIVQTHHVEDWAGALQQLSGR
jgi:steroid delta-isomerase-like uncharacterized protein